MSKLTEQEKSIWADHIQSQLSSGLSQQDYCKKQNIKVHCFWYWKRKLKSVTTRKSARAANRRDGGFIPVTVAANTPSPALSIVLPDGTTFKGVTENNGSLTLQLIGALK